MSSPCFNCNGTGNAPPSYYKTRAGEQDAHAKKLAAKDQRIAELEDLGLRAAIILEEIKPREIAPVMDNSATPCIPQPMPNGRRSSVVKPRPAEWWDELRAVRDALQRQEEGGAS